MTYVNSNTKREYIEPNISLWRKDWIELFIANKITPPEVVVMYGPNRAESHFTSSDIMYTLKVLYEELIERI